MRVIVVDDHAVVRAGIALLVERHDGFDVVGEAGTADGGVSQARRHQPDVILLDLTMPGKSGIEVLPTLREVVPDASVIILSMEDDPSYIRAAFELGAKGYLLKEAAHDDLMTALEEIAAGREYLHPQLGARMQAVEAAARRREEDDPLSDREREVLRLLALGHTNQEIAKMLFISVRTVESHRAHILTKLRLNTRAELVRYALAEGMLEDIESTDESPA
jgi:DNA-binding NarL/FixJ family response regulator